MLPYGRQTICDADLAAVAETLKSGWLTTGPKVAEFEERFAEHLGAKFAVAVNNGTSALHLAMLAAEVGQGDRVVTSPNTFLASANCAAFVGATPDFSDIDPVSYNLCPTTLEANWQDDTKVVVAVDYAGQTAEMPAIAQVARSRGAIVIEDACHAIGGRFQHDGREWKVGGHPWADITTFSFHPVKTMTTGEGGMVVTDNEELAQRARVLRHHGMNRDSETCVGLGSNGDPEWAGLDEKGPWYYEMPELGFNFRITDFQCAMGLTQLEQLDSFTQRRREIVGQYNAAFASSEFAKQGLIETPKLRNEADCDLTSWHLYTLKFDFPKIGTTRTEFMQQLRDRGIGTQVLYIPVHLQPWYRNTYGYGLGKCPIAERYYLSALSIPLYPTMSDDDVATVIEGVNQCLASAGDSSES